MNKIYTVRQISAYIKNMFAQDFLMNRVSVKGEISNLKDHPTGHLYFTLKDDSAQLNCIMFAGSRRTGQKCRLKDGMQVEAAGSISVYENAGRYQFYVKEIKEDGEGDLYKRFLELKERLAEMGMFDESFKRPIPRYARTVGIVTASSGAALRDIMQIAERRNPHVQLILSPALVQGDGAPESLIRAILRMDAYHPDVMIVGRGGGSQEDLWAFNDEGVARAIFDCDTPVISAVGHEVDFTIADFVADHRAPTPSAAAEIAVFDQKTFENEMAGYMRRMESAMGNRVTAVRSGLQRSLLRLKLSHPGTRLSEQKLRAADLETRLHRAMSDTLNDRRTALKLYAERLNGRSPLSKLTGGYGYVSTEKGAVRHAADVTPGDKLRITLSDGIIESKAERIIQRKSTQD